MDQFNAITWINHTRLSQGNKIKLETYLNSDKFDNDLTQFTKTFPDMNIEAKCICVFTEYLKSIDVI